MSAILNIFFICCGLFVWWQTSRHKKIEREERSYSYWILNKVPEEENDLTLYWLEDKHPLFPSEHHYEVREVRTQIINWAFETGVPIVIEHGSRVRYITIKFPTENEKLMFGLMFSELISTHSYDAIIATGHYNKPSSYSDNY